MNRSVCAAIAVVLTVVACAKASRTGGCTPVPDEFLAAGPAFRECAVDRRAELSREPQIDGIRIEGSRSCFSASYDVIVDTTGRLVVGTAKLVTTNNKLYADAVRRQLDEVRYEPAEKGRQRVQQLVRYKAVFAAMIVVSPAGRPPPSVNASGSAPRC